MDKIIPRPELAAAVQTVYPKVSESGGRPPIPLERPARILPSPPCSIVREGQIP